MTYRITQRYRAGALFVALLLLSFIMLFISSKDLRISPKSAGVTIFGAIQKTVTFSSTYIKDTFNSISELKDLQHEHQLLLKEIARFRTLQRDYSSLLLENEQLRTQLELSEESILTLIPAQVIGKDPSDFFSGITIDKGTVHGIGKNSAVVAYTDGFQALVGRIAEVSPFNAKIQPIYERESFVAARLQLHRFEGLIEGNGDREHSLLMRYVVKRAKESISYGDIIITSGMNSIFPKNIYIGRIREIRSKDWNPDIEILVEPIIDFDRLEYVYVVEISNEK